MLTAALDEPCGEHFVYRDFVQCGETWSRLAAASAHDKSFDNVPRVPATFAAIQSLCSRVLDPLVKHFGRVELSYGFASSNLTKHIVGRIAPSLDQHAGHELGRKGKAVCSRLGIAADFIVPGVNSRAVARWVVERTQFDRLYFYDSDCSIHVSVGPENARQVVHMKRGRSGRRVPRVVTNEFFQVGCDAAVDPEALGLISREM